MLPNSISDHRMLMAEFVPTPHTFGWMQPKGIVVHETGTRIKPGSAVAYCRAPKKTNPIRVGYHVIIERDGTIVQLARFNKKVRHAGVSSHKGRMYCNSFMIGVGLVGPTELKGNERRAKSFYGRWFTSEDGIKAADSPHHGRGHIWLPYTMDQLVSLDEVVAEIRDAYPDIEDDDVVGHYHVSPGRKIDPSPLLDFSAVGKLDEQLPAVDGISAQELSHAADQLSTGAVAADTSKVARDNEVGKVLKKQSREYSSADTLEKAAAGVAVVGTGTEVTKAFVPADAVTGFETLKTVKTYMDFGGSMISAYGVHLVIAAAVAVVAYMFYIKKWKRESYTAGLYEPSGADTE